ncbi:unnamed protein product [Cercopithifilaria johnstoni]|uniref:glucuronosyltransferase n=1 Tax=Cercopithifilaria johnstoni TaxID=2874296 RepID=A0A8J2LU03_9BILA|nr:unnamed protein product [Cercopithifilaria johnstoni]
MILILKNSRLFISFFSYRKSAQKLKKMIRHKPVSARERVIRYTEFVIKYGPFDNFNTAGSELNIFQYFLVDVLLMIVPFGLLIISESCITRILFILFGFFENPHSTFFR